MEIKCSGRGKMVCTGPEETELAGGQLGDLVLGEIGAVIRFGASRNL